MALAPIIIDLDDPASLEVETDREAKERQVTINLTVRYLRGDISNSTLITLRVWMGILPAIHHTEQRIHIPLALRLAEIGANDREPSFLVGACMMMSEIMRFHSLEEQASILQKLG